MNKIVFKAPDEAGFRNLAEQAARIGRIDPALYEKYDVKRGLRDLSGRGVMAGLTEIGDVHSYIVIDGEMIPTPGKLYYRGLDVEDIVAGFLAENRYGFEETVYLLLFGKLPSRDELSGFEALLAANRGLPDDFVRSSIMNSPSPDVMNALARGLLTLYSYDPDPDSCDLENVLRQSVQLIANFPLLSVYAYQTYVHYFKGRSLVIHSPKPEYTTAQNILHTLKPDNAFFDEEAKLLDLALVLHAEHGGGNNSTFVTHVVTSSGTDTYSAMAASLCSLKGPRHGGANVKVCEMFADIKQNVGDWADDEEVADYLHKLLNREAFDRSGLIYGIGHAVYSVSDPRTDVLKKQVVRLAELKGQSREMNLYRSVERLAPHVIEQSRKMYKGVSANVDFYSGFVYQMLDIPVELFTPIFASARIAGWCAHRLEEIVNNGKIIRPAYKAVAPRAAYTPIGKR